MVTDRYAWHISYFYSICTAGLLLILSHLYPDYRFFWTMCMILDVGSHWVQMYCSQVCHMGSHKNMSENDPWILRKYYTSRPVLFHVCFFNEAFFVLIYMYKFVKLEGNLYYAFVGFTAWCGFVFFIKQVFLLYIIIYF